MPESILIVDDEETLRESLGRLMSREGFAVTTTGTGEDALALLERSGYDLVISDIFLPGMDGIEVLRKARERNPDQLVIMVTAYASLETAVEALRAGAYDYIMKPVIHEEIKTLVRHALVQRSLRAENTILKKQIEKVYDFGHIIGESPGLKKVLGEVAKVAGSKSNVLITGETGTGKELFARAVHYNSGRKDKPFVPINCSAIPEQLLESELFGHVKGAFTGATSAKKGLFEVASGGTVFLDEIAEMSPGLQAKLLRALEDGEVRPVGGAQSAKVDVRFISATNRDLAELSTDGGFREDLYYRINTINLELPPLRDRRDDIPRLAAHFMARFAAELGKHVAGISEDALGLMDAYAWPGNVRELRNIIERAVLITETDTINAEHLPESMRAPGTVADECASAGMTLDGYAKSVIVRYQGHLGEQRIADMLGITRKSLWEKRKKWGLKRP